MEIEKQQGILESFKSRPVEDLEAMAAKSDLYFQDLAQTHSNLDIRQSGELFLDPLPKVIPPDQVPFLTRAADQWGRLLTALYLDFLGPRTLLSSGAVDHGFFWETLGVDPSVFQVLPPGVATLSLVRLDLTGQKNGGYTLRSLGTSLPRGLGYSIEARLVHSRFYGSHIPHDNLVRMAPVLQGLKDLWQRLSLTHKDEPAIMVWTSGPGDPHYREPVFLSRYFGYPLVESRDLTVRQGRVFLKTLMGLQPVDVLVRMVPDHMIDPLSGNPGGFGGVAGLMQAVRDGTVVVTNGPGAGFLEKSALLPRLPELCRRVLDEELLIPPVVGESLHPDEEDFFRTGEWTGFPVGLRLFTALQPQGWELLPGGLVQKLTKKESAEVTWDPKDFSGTKKDLWFLSPSSVQPVSLLPTGERPSEINRTADLPSRLADDLFWLGRYSERAWIDLRFMEKWWESHFQGGPEYHREGTDLVKTLVRTLGIIRDPEGGGEDFWTHSRLFETLGEITRVAGQVLDRFSLETHRILKDFGEYLKPVPAHSLLTVLGQVNLRLAAFSGLVMESMTRSFGWRFLDMGRRLERADLVVESMESFFLHQEGDENLRILLEIFDSTLTYSTRYRLSPQRGPVLDLLLLDETNPRSLAFQVERLTQHVGELPRGDLRPYHSREERRVLGLMTKLRLCDASTLVPGVLETFLAELRQDLELLSQDLHQTYLAKISTAESLQVRGRLV